uniref:Uncharacterized protein n=1 Tax=Plectus sambesii TaxID=2011161 RepID=A0A914W444_9BILA
MNMTLLGLLCVLLLGTVASALNCYENDFASDQQNSVACTGGMNACSLILGADNSPVLKQCQILPAGIKSGCNPFNTATGSGTLCLCQCDNCNDNRADVDACNNRNNGALPINSSFASMIFALILSITYFH